jgi:hypothetical protein
MQQEPVLKFEETIQLKQQGLLKEHSHFDQQPFEPPPLFVQQIVQPPPFVQHSQN